MPQALKQTIIVQNLALIHCFTFTTVHKQSIKLSIYHYRMQRRKTNLREADGKDVMWIKAFRFQEIYTLLILTGCMDDGPK